MSPKRPVGMSRTIWVISLDQVFQERLLRRGWISPRLQSKGQPWGKLEKQTFK